MPRPGIVTSASGVVSLRKKAPRENIINAIRNLLSRSASWTTALPAKEGGTGASNGSGIIKASREIILSRKWDALRKKTLELFETARGRASRSRCQLHRKRESQSVCERLQCLCVVDRVADCIRLALLRSVSRV